MNFEETINRLKDLIHTCDVGIKEHSQDKELFSTDKKALKIAIQAIEENILNKSKDYENKWKALLNILINDFNQTQNTIYLDVIEKMEKIDKVKDDKNGTIN